MPGLHTRSSPARSRTSVPPAAAAPSPPTPAQVPALQHAWQPQCDYAPSRSLTAPVRSPEHVRQATPPSRPASVQQSQGPGISMLPWDSDQLTSIRMQPVQHYLAKVAAKHDPHYRILQFKQFHEVIRSSSLNQSLIYIDPPQANMHEVFSVQYVPNEVFRDLEMRMKAAWDVAVGVWYTYGVSTSQRAVVVSIMASPNWRTVASSRNTRSPNFAARLSWSYPTQGTVGELPVLAIVSEMLYRQEGRRKLLYSIVVGQASWRSSFANWVASMATTASSSSLPSG